MWCGVRIANTLAVTVLATTMPQTKTAHRYLFVRTISVHTEKGKTMAEIKPCPFCGGTDIRFSARTTTINYKRAYHFAMYCNSCNCYGARVLWKHDGKNIDRSEEFMQRAAEAWNRRVNNE